MWSSTCTARLASGAHGDRIPLARIFAAAATFVLGGVANGAPSHVHRALYATYLAVLGTPVPSPHTSRDLAGYLIGPDLGPEVVVAEARRWRGETVLAEVVAGIFATLTFDYPTWRS